MGKSVTQTGDLRFCRAPCSTGPPPQGTYLGTLQDVSHLDQVGWINAARYSWARFRGRDIAFHPATFYLSIADHLARDVDGVQPASGAIEEDPWDASSDRGGSEGQT
jgi:hypothetical protein